MAKQIKPVVQQISRSRQGGQVTVAVHKRPNLDTDGRVSVDINLLDLPIPERHYVPDRTGVVYDEISQQVRLLFAQVRVTGEIRSLVVISLSPEAVYMFLRTLEKFTPETETFLSSYEIPRPPPLFISAEPEQTVAMTANIIAIARAGRDATTDFYHAPAAALHALGAQDSLGLDPVIRIEGPMSLIALVIDELIKLKPRLPKEIV